MNVEKRCFIQRISAFNFLIEQLPFTHCDEKQKD